MQHHLELFLSSQDVVVGEDIRAAFDHHARTQIAVSQHVPRIDHVFRIHVNRHNRGSDLFGDFGKLFLKLSRIQGHNFHGRLS